MRMRQNVRKINCNDDFSTKLAYELQYMFQDNLLVIFSRKGVIYDQLCERSQIDIVQAVGYIEVRS